MTNPLLSIVIPAHNEESRLPETLDKIDAFLQTQPYSAEVVIVENGSSDRTLELAQEYAQRRPYVRALHEEGRGKGLAVRRGMLEAVGDYRFICDADLSMPIEQVNRFLPPQCHQEIAIASREAPGAVRHGEPPYRHIVGRVFNTMVRIIALHSLQDTQCGFKCFSAAAAEDLFPYQITNGWTFDVEVLFIARKRGYKIVEVPIDWYYSPHSKINVLRDSIHMGLDLLTIRWYGLQGRYRRA